MISRATPAICLTVCIALLAAPASAAATAYENPVYDFSFPDPGVLRTAAGDYYAYGTGSGFPVIHSTDLAHWQPLGKALPDRPSWVVATGDSHPWAPSVLRSGAACPGAQSPGCYLLYYVGLSGMHSPATHCVAVAWSPTPAGPFHDLGPIQASDAKLDGSGRPPGCGDDAGYSNIDPAPFVDADGSAYLYVATNRRCSMPTIAECPVEPTVSVIPLGTDLMTAVGPRKPLFAGIPGSWEQEPGQEPKVENPWAQRRGSTVYLFYSGGDYRSAYGMGYGTSSSPTGPFSKAPANPILRQTASVLSPGGGSITEGPGGDDWVVYHGRSGSFDAPRTLRIDPLVWRSDGAVAVRGPTTGPQSTGTTVAAPVAPAPPRQAPRSVAAGPSSARVQAALRANLAVIARDLRRLGIRGLVRRRGFAARELDALLAGRFSVALSGAPRGSGVARKLTLASGSRSVSAAGRYALIVKLSRRGRHLLRGDRRATITVTVTFRDGHRRAASARRSVRLRR